MMKKRKIDPNIKLITGWVVRDKDRKLWIFYGKKPKRDLEDLEWCGGDGHIKILNVNQFPEVTWETEPRYVENLKIKLQQYE